MKFLFTILYFMLLLSQTTLHADRYSISAIDGSNFPEIRANIQVLDNAGNSVDNLTADDFDVFENGISMDPSLKLVCEEGNKEVSVLLILDRSDSMKDTVSQNPLALRWDWVHYAVTSFVNKINFVGRTTVGITNFGGTCKLTCPFTNDKKQLLDSLDKIQIIGKTIYDFPFMDANTGAVELFKSRPSDVRKVAIFLTDGEPTDPPETDKIIHAMQLANIQVYSITLNTPKNQDLNSIAKYTGGESWRVDTRDELDDLYNRIAEKLQNLLLCYLSWNTTHGCDDDSRNRLARVEYLRLNYDNGRVLERPFVLPEKSVPRLNNQRSLYNLGMAQKDEVISGYVDFTPQYDDFQVTGASFDQNQSFFSVDWEGRTLPFDIPEGKTEKIKVVFAQKNIQVRTANLLLEGYPCKKSIPVVAGAEDLVIDAPVGGESFSLCDSIDILWSGVNKNSHVILSYDLNNSNIWDTITTSATGLSYKWQVPQEGNYRIRADKKNKYRWTCLITGNGEDGATGLHVSDNIYAVGYFENYAAFGPAPIGKSSKGKKDYYLMAINPNTGKPRWVETNGGSQNDSATAVYNDNGTIFVTGSAMDNCNFGSKTPDYIAKNRRYLFVSKHDASGKVLDGNILGVLFESQNKNLDMLGTKIVTDDTNVYIEGLYTGIFDFGLYSLPYTATPKVFSVIYNKSDLVLKEVHAGSLSGINFPREYYYHDYVYAATFKDSVSRYDSVAVAQGVSDGIVAYAFPNNAYTSHVNSQNFEVVSPEIAFNNTSLDAGDCALGNSITRLLTSAITNNGSIPVKIQSEQIANDPLGEFSITPSLLGEEILPGASLDVTVIFTPQERGQRSAQLLLGVDCLDPVPIDVVGNGQCEFDAKSVNFMEVAASVYETKNNVCVFENLSNDSLVITPVIEGPDAADFSLSQTGTFSVQPGECWETDITCYSTTAGQKSAFINFNLHTECPDNHAALEANVVITDVTVNDIDWKEKRVGSINDDKIVIKNNSNLDLKVISFTNTTASDRIELTSPPADFIIPKNGEYTIDVSFKPNAEQYYESTYEFQVENAPSTNTFKLSGTGVLPAYSLNWICPDEVEPGQTSTAYLEITNSGSADNLKLYDITISQGASDYTFISNVTDLDISKGNTETIELSFTPILRGSRAVSFDIKSDAVAGNESNPTITQTHDFTCEVQGLLIPNSLDLGTVLVCDDFEESITVTNPSENESVTIKEISLQDGSSFYVTHPDLEHTILPTKDMKIHVHLNADAQGSYTDILTIKDIDDNTYNVNLSGKSVNPSFYSNVDTLTVVPYGNNQSVFAIRASVPVLSYSNITELKLELEVDENLINILQVLNTRPSGFTWTKLEKVADGVFRLEGSGSLSTAFDDVILLVEYKALLGDNLVSPLKIRPIYEGCESEYTTPLYLAINGICFNEGILISQGEYHTAIDKVSPNPINQATELSFTTGYEAGTTLEVYDMQGRKIETLFNAKVPSGKYSATLDTDKYNSGAYILKLRSGHVLKTEKVMISK